MEEKKRSGPDPAEPVEFNGVRYEAEANHVRAYDSTTNQLLWDKEIYKTVMEPTMEEDKQWVFITKLSIQDSQLIVKNEKGTQYRVDPSTGSVASSE